MYKTIEKNMKVKEAAYQSFLKCQLYWKCCGSLLNKVIFD